MSSTLSTLRQAIAVRPEYVRDEPTKIRVNQKNSGVSGGSFTITTGTPNESKREPEASKLFSVDGKVGSPDQRRRFCDASGLPLFEMSRHNKVGATWFLYMPGAKSEPIVRFCPRFSIFKDKIDVEVTNNDGTLATLEVRGEDIWKSGTMVYHEGALVMKAKISNYSAVWIPGKRPEWEVEIAQGLDIALASAIVVMMAATMYSSAGTASLTGSGTGAADGAAAGSD